MVQLAIGQSLALDSGYHWVVHRSRMYVTLLASQPLMSGLTAEALRNIDHMLVTCLTSQLLKSGLNAEAPLNKDCV